MEMTVGRLREGEDRDPESPCKTGCLVASRRGGRKVGRGKGRWVSKKPAGFILAAKLVLFILSLRTIEERRALAPIWVELSRSTSEKKDRIHDGKEFERSSLVISLIISDVDRSRVRFCPMEADGQRAGQRVKTQERRLLERDD
ncbi:hypothetical protein V1478_017255, partial [Vespula squamosa]